MGAGEGFLSKSFRLQLVPVGLAATDTWQGWAWGTSSNKKQAWVR